MEKELSDGLTQLFEEAGFDSHNGLHVFSKSDEWFHQFPYRVSKALRDVIKPDAFFFCINQNRTSETYHVEPLNQPFVLFFDRPDEERAAQIPKWTFSFNQAPIIVVANADETLNFYHGYDFKDGDRTQLKEIPELCDGKAASVLHITHLFIGPIWELLYEKYYKKAQRVDKFLLKNIRDARRLLVAQDAGNLPPRIANKLIARLIFTRYLIDRGVSFRDQQFIIGNSKQARQDAFLSILSKGRADLYRFFEYLSEKFNGDLLPVIQDENLVDDNHIKILYYLFSSSNFFKSGEKYNGKYTVQPSLFNLYDFEIIPVELISNIYELFVGEKEDNTENSVTQLDELEKQKEVKSYYTPPFLVDYILSQTIEPLIRKRTEASCKVLDPACGSGIFLVETTRKLIEKQIEVNYEKTGKSYVENAQLWELVKKNIFGIDIDEAAIDIAIFSLYITLLDYKTPIEIENFKFELVRNTNLFGGVDFFSDKHIFNSILKNQIELDVIFGNPPWGKVPKSMYLQYMASLKETEKKQKDKSGSRIVLDFDKDEISQAFLLRVNDFINSDRSTKCMFIVTGKNLYNKTSNTQRWRSYFLSRFKVNQVLELSGVSNKIAGGYQIFEGAKQTAVVLAYQGADAEEDTGKSVIKHITARPNRFFRYYKAVFIEKHDVKLISQKFFMEGAGGYDWLWKVLVHGNILDFQFVRRLKEEFTTMGTVFKENNLDYQRGLQAKFNVGKDGKKYDTEEFREWDYLEIDSNKDFQPYSVCPSRKWKDKLQELIRKRKIGIDGKIGFMPRKKFFQGEKVILKRGMLANSNFQAVAAYSSNDVLFSDSVISLKFMGDKLEDRVKSLMHNIIGVINSRLCTYFLLQTGSSLGIEKTRTDITEYLSLPVSKAINLSDKVKALHELYARKYDQPLFWNQSEVDTHIREIRQAIENDVLDAYRISDLERSLINYAVEIAIPVVKRESAGRGDGQASASMYDPLLFQRLADQEYLGRYANVFVEHFRKRYEYQGKAFLSCIYIAQDYICVHFRISDTQPESPISFFQENGLVGIIGKLGIRMLTQDMYIQRDIRGFTKDSFYLVKPNERKLWHVAVAYADLSEFVSELVKSEVRMMTD